MNTTRLQQRVWRVKCTPFATNTPPDVYCIFIWYKKGRVVRHNKLISKAEQTHFLLQIGRPANFIYLDKVLLFTVTLNMLLLWSIYKNSCMIDSRSLLIFQEATFWELQATGFHCVPVSFTLTLSTAWNQSPVAITINWLHQNNMSLFGFTVNWYALCSFVEDSLKVPLTADITGWMREI